MKIRILLIFCLLQLISFSVFGQTLTYDPGDGDYLYINGIPVRKPNRRVSSSSSSRGNYWENLGSETGKKLGDAGAEIFKSLMMGNANAPASVYYDNKGIPYTSAKAAFAANKRYEKEQQFQAGKQDLQNKWKGQKTAHATLELKGSKTTPINELKLKSLRPMVTVENDINRTKVLNNPNSSLVYTGTKSTVATSGLEGLEDALDYTLREPVKPLREPNINITEMNDLTIDMVSNLYGIVIPLEAEALLPPVVGEAAGVVAGGMIDAGADLAHSYNNGQSLKNTGVWKNAGLTFTGSVAGGIPTGKKYEEVTRQILMGAAKSKSKGGSTHDVTVEAAWTGFTEGVVIKPITGADN